MNRIITDDNVNISFKHTRSNVACSSICILAHGITVDMTEGGIFDRMAAQINDIGIDTLQFDYRGHGNSDGKSKGMTIAGEVLDLSAVFNYCDNIGYRSIYLLAASFGAVSTSCLPFYYKKKVDKLILWNPVLNLKKTFIEPLLPWGKESFNKASFEKMNETGSLFIDGEFEIGAALVNEFYLYHPEDQLKEFDAPIMILHGDKDTYVPYEVAKDCSESLDNCTFKTIAGSEHGFGRIEDEEMVVNSTIAHLKS
ncbi:MAG TPA: alpha/beta hydrolase [Gammaproteobacteria bacterium]|nr:alpha/beta hydrolase [Gammaproteobacteria bacterium]